MLSALLTASLLAVSPAARNPKVEAVVARVDAQRIRSTVEKLASFHTRHTLSDPDPKGRGIGAARAWLAAEYTALTKLPGSRLRPFEDRFVAQPEKRIPQPTELVNVGAFLPGTDKARLKEVLVVSGHYDSRATDPMDATSAAPGAVDDGSGTAISLELARVFASERPAIGIYFVAVAGEEQGLTGSAHLAKRFADEGLTVVAMVSADIAGNTRGQDGVLDNVTARLFSEGVPAVDSEERKKVRDAIGGENDSPAREWARYLERVGERYVENLDLWLMLRRDRISRGSDHTSFSRNGFPAVRLSETHEHYDRQHQNVRTEEGRPYGDVLEHFDHEYSAKLTRALAAAYHTLAHAPAAPRQVVLGGGVTPTTQLRWTLPADPRIAGVILYRRRADALHWQRADRHPRAERLALPNVVPDNHVFAVATVDADGNESVPSQPAALE